MTPEHQGRSVMVAVAAALVAGMTAVGLHVTTRPAPALPVHPVRVPAPPSPADQPSTSARHVASTVVTVSPAWIRSTAASAGIPEPAARAYGAATLHLAREDPGCHLAWTTLAGIGWVESHQGTIDGRVLQADGRPDRAITGVDLDGSGDVAAVPDGAGGFQRALGPLQFIRSTWHRWKADGDGDGVADPQDLDDAGLAAGRYLCSSGGDLATGSGWSAAIFSYNHSDDYVRAVYDAAKTYADRTS
jgi:membrane-bound lytic murein transglycosylase B